MLSPLPCRGLVLVSIKSGKKKLSQHGFPFRQCSLYKREVFTLGLPSLSLMYSSSFCSSPFVMRSKLTMYLVTHSSTAGSPNPWVATPVSMVSLVNVTRTNLWFSGSLFFARYPPELFSLALVGNVPQS